MCSFCAGHLLLICLHSETLQEKTDFLFVNGCQLEITSGSRFGVTSNLPLIAVTPFDLDLCRCYVCYHDLWEFICTLVLLCLGDTASLASFISTGSYNHSASFTWFPDPQGEGFDRDTSFRIKCSMVFQFVHFPIVCLCISSNFLQVVT